MSNVYGKLRKEDVPILQSLLKSLRKYNLRGALHGTSLWNSKYKDVDLLVISAHNDVIAFKQWLAKALNEHQAQILAEGGNEVIGLDYEPKIKDTVFHISFVRLL